MHISEICFSFIDVSFDFVDKEKVKKWILTSIASEGSKLGCLTYVFCNDEYLLDINLKYLNSRHLTDVIAFQYDGFDSINGDVFISVDRVRENAKLFNATDINEMSRVMLHGALHLIGYKDKCKRDKEEMTRIEDKYLSLHPLF